MDSSAKMTCVMKVNVQCDTCKRKVMEVLQNLHGVYSVNIDAEQGTVKVSGKVNPNIILNVLNRHGKHAEVSCLQFNGEAVENGYYHYGDNWYNSPYGLTYPYQHLGAPDYLSPNSSHHYLSAPIPPPTPPFVTHVPPLRPPPLRVPPPSDYPERCVTM